MKVKVFHGISPGEIEAKVQHWLDETLGVTIQHMAQSQNAAGWVTLTVSYDVKSDR